MNKFDIDISLERFTRIFHLSCESADIFNLEFDDFEFPDDESALIASWVLHDNDNPGLVKHEEVKYYTLTTKFLSKIEFSIFFLNRVSIAMLGVVHHFSFVVFRKALELISRSSSLTSCYLSTSWFWVEISPTGWLLLIFLDISKLISPARLPILLLLYWSTLLKRMQSGTRVYA